MKKVSLSNCIERAWVREEEKRGLPPDRAVIFEEAAHVSSR
jgi:hypothetical protein